MDPRLPTLLIVEDNEMNLEALSRLLSRRGFTILGAGTGEEALRIAAGSHLDLILMDIGLPGIDGYETTRRIRARHGTKHRILALTAAAFEQDRAKAIDCGMDGMLEKPIDLDRLREVLGRGRAEAQHPVEPPAEPRAPLDPREPDAPEWTSETVKPRSSSHPPL